MIYEVLMSNNKTGLAPVYPARHTVNQLLRKTRAVVRMHDPQVANRIRIDGKLGEVFAEAVSVIERSNYIHGFTLYVTAALIFAGYKVSSALNVGLTEYHRDQLFELSLESAQQPPEMDEDLPENFDL